MESSDQAKSCKVDQSTCSYLAEDQGSHEINDIENEQYLELYSDSLKETLIVAISFLQQRENRKDQQSPLRPRKPSIIADLTLKSNKSSNKSQ